MKLPKISNFSIASQLSLLAVVILLGAIFFTVNSALQQQNASSKASTGSVTTLGLTTVGAVPDKNDNNCLNGLKVTTPSTGGDITSISAYVQSAQATPLNQYSFGIYSDNGGKPANLLAHTATGTVVSGWNTLPISFIAAPNTSYWLMYYTNGQNNIPYNNQNTPNNGAYICPGTFGTFPSNIGGATVDAAQYSIYATLGSAATPTSAPTATPVPVTSQSTGNLLINPSFESGTTGWDFKVTSPAVGSFITTTSNHEAGAAAAQIAISSPSSNSWYIQLSTHSSLSIQAGQKYMVTFWAKASSARQIEAVIQGALSPYTVYGGISPTITTSWQQYSFTVSPSSSNSVVFLGFNVASTTGTVWIDNVSFTQGTGSPTAIPTIKPTAVPTAIPTAIPTVLPTPFPTATPLPLPTAVPQPTNTPVPGDTVLAFNVGLHGIGTGGDSANPNSTGNMNPLHPARTVTVDIYNSQNQLVTSQQGTVNFDSVSGKFLGTVDLGSNFTSGLYTVKVKTDQYLRAIVPGIQTITSGQTITLPLVTLVAGDINGDNQINIEDYNILIGCYSDLLPATDCNATNNVLSDITDDGHVNEFDYNLFLRELTNIGGQ